MSSLNTDRSCGLGKRVLEACHQWDTAGDQGQSTQALGSQPLQPGPLIFHMHSREWYLRSDLGPWLREVGLGSDGLGQILKQQSKFLNLSKFPDPSEDSVILIRKMGLIVAPTAEDW